MSEAEIRNGKKRVAPDGGAVKIAVTDYIGIASDEPKRIERHKDKPGIEMPLVEAGWTEAMCRQWCEENGLLSPIYTDSARGGVGSAIIKALTNSANYAEITRSCGH